MPSTKGTTCSGFRKRKVSTCVVTYPFDCERVMKCPRNEITKFNNMEKAPAAQVSKILPPKTSPMKEATFKKPHFPPTEVTTVLFSPKNNSPVNNKENSRVDRSLDEALEDSGYISLHNSQIEDEAGCDRKISPVSSPSKCLRQEHRVRAVALPAVSTPVDNSRMGTPTHTLPSTPSRQRRYPHLPILDFQKAVCAELAKSYQEKEEFDWSIVSKVAENYALDRVTGRKMGLEHVDILSSLQLRNMERILTKVMGMLGDADLLSCKRVCKTWRKIVLDDESAQERCIKAEAAFRESRNSRKPTGLTRDVMKSRVPLSCTQTLSKAAASSSSSSSSSSAVNCRNTRQTSRFNEYLQAASKLKQHESLRSCRRCGSPATHSAEVQRAICTRQSCGFEFCSRCKEPFHGSAPCRTLKLSVSTKSVILPGSALSKRNVRRL